MYARSNFSTIRYPLSTSRAQSDRVSAAQVFEGIQETYSSYFMDPSGAGGDGDEPIRTEHTPAVKSFQLGVETPVLGAISERKRCLFSAFERTLQPFKKTCQRRTRHAFN